MSEPRFGLDFGTSNSAVAMSDGEGVRLLPIDPIGGDTLPSVLYVRRDGTAQIGHPAIQSFLADNRARGPVKREFKLLGITMASSNPRQKTVEAHILADTSSPGRFFQSLKTFLGDPLLGHTNVFGDERGLEDLIAMILSGIFERVEQLTGTRPTSATVGRPVEFVGGREVEERARTRLEQAARLAGLQEVRFVEEPVAAARAADVPAGLALVFDFGGGTLDLCVTRRHKGAIDVLGTAGVDVAGDRFTQLLIDQLVAPHLGAEKRWGPKGLILPRFITNAIGDWRALSALNEKPILEALDDLQSLGAPKRELAALRSAIELQLGYEIFAAVDATKIELSSTQLALFSFHRGAVDIDHQASRRAFEVAIAPLFARIDAALTQVLERSGVKAEQIIEIVCTGGSSAIPAARSLLRKRFAHAELRDAAAHTAVAAGLARA
ncbi:MAG TPA: Hsp70 family protein [Candidatus Saccharimonadales bacterium]|nr:Hsp70 family protein [Candidatus Saccharimonadales bacterium]